MSEPHAVRLTPVRWRRWVGFAVCAILLVPVVVTAILSAPTASPLPWWLYLVAVPPIVGALYIRNLTRAITIVPGVEFRWRGPLFARHSVPIDGSTVIEFYAQVDGSDWPIRKTKSPIGVIDSKWATITSTGSRVLRLSMRYWREASLPGIATTAPAQLKIINTATDPTVLQKQAPYLYSWLEKRPRLFMTIFVVFILWMVFAIILDLGFIATGFHW